jgi:hypothetical protein
MFFDKETGQMKKIYLATEILLYVIVLVGFFVPEAAKKDFVSYTFFTLFSSFKDIYFIFYSILFLLIFTSIGLILTISSFFTSNKILWDIKAYFPVFGLVLIIVLGILLSKSMSNIEGLQESMGAIILVTFSYCGIIGSNGFFHLMKK